MGLFSGVSNALGKIGGAIGIGGGKGSALAGALGLGAFGAPIASIASGALPFAGDAISQWINYNQIKHTNEHNERQQWNMWNATNAYNSPSAQMQRFIQAGLNPNLIYGQMSNQNASMGNVGRSDAFSFDFGSPLEKMSSMLDGYIRDYKAEQRYNEEVERSEKWRELNYNLGVEKMNRSAESDRLRNNILMEQLKKLRLENKYIEGNSGVNGGLTSQQVRDGERKTNKLLNSFVSPLTWKLGYNLYDRAKNGVVLGPASALVSSIGLGKLFRNYADWVISDAVLDKSARFGRKYSPFARQYSENIWRKK